MLRPFLILVASYSVILTGCIQQPAAESNRGQFETQNPVGEDDLKDDKSKDDNDVNDRTDDIVASDDDPIRPPVVIDDIVKTPNNNEEPQIIQAAFEIAPRPANNRIDNNFLPFFEEGEKALSDINRQLREGEDVENIRYLTFTHLDYLDLDEQQFVRLKSGIINSMAAMINSVSTDDFIQKPIPIDSRMNIMRIDISDYGWNQAEWDRLVNDDNNNNDKEEYPYPNNFDPNVAAIAQVIGDAVPIVRADWLLTEATKVASYTDLLDLPNNLNQLENSLGVNRVDDILETFEDPNDTPRAIRVGMGPGNSKMSDNNRIIERHDSNEGYFWVGYDFAPANGNIRRLVFNSPFGPVRDNGINDIDINGGDVNRRAFDPNVISTMFTLPNGMQGFMLANQNGNRINQANTNVLFNPNDRDDQGEMETGFSCLQCHMNNGAQGILPATDEMRRVFADANPETTDDDFTDGILALHQEQSFIDQVIDRDNQFLLNSINQTNMISDVNGPLTTLVNYYELDMSLDMVASELNITRDQLDRIKTTLDEDLQVLLEAAESSSLERDIFELIFDDLVEEIFDIN